MSVDVVIDVVINDVLCDIAGSRGEIATAPEFTASIAFSDGRKLLLYFTRRPSFDGTHEIGDGNVGWDFHKHMDMIAGQNAVEDAHTHVFGNVGDNLAYPQSQIAGENFKAIFGDPDDMVTVVKKVWLLVLYSGIALSAHHVCWTLNAMPVGCMPEIMLSILHVRATKTSASQALKRISGWKPEV